MSGTRSPFGPSAVLSLLVLSTTPATAQDLILANGAAWNTCEGTFYDSGGPGGNYGSSQDLTAVLCPGGGAGSGAASAISFLSFAAGSALDPGDALAVHDGTTTAAPILVTGTYANNLAGQTFTATGPSGCLTFHWTSSLFGTAAGWAATVTTGPDAGDNGSLTLCSDQPAFLLFDALGGDPDVGGFWSGPQGPHGPQYDPGTDASGIYTYTVIDGSLCSDSASVSITNVASPDPGEDAVLLICDSGPPLQLLTSLGGTPSPGGTWTGPGGAHNGVFVPGTDIPGAYTYSVGGNAPCPNATATVTVAVTGQPDAGVDGTLATCDTATALDLFSGLGGTPDIGGTWQDLEGTGALQDGLLNTTGLPAGSYAFRYSVQVPGCGSDDALVTVLVVQGVSVTGLFRQCFYSRDVSVITFSITGGDTASYVVDGIPGTLTASTPYRFTSEELPDSLAYTITVSDANGCGTVVLFVDTCTYAPSIFVPQSFSPNGDGINDLFEIPGLQDFPGNEMTIFNRWGAEVYHVRDYHIISHPWMGSFDNASSSRLLPSGTYYYILDLHNGMPAVRGFIYLNGGGQ